jgi:hypothetical protein
LTNQIRDWERMMIRWLESLIRLRNVHFRRTVKGDAILEQMVIELRRKRLNEA